MVEKSRFLRFFWSIFGSQISDPAINSSERSHLSWSISISSTKPANDHRKPIQNHQTQPKHNRNDVKQSRKHI